MRFYYQKRIFTTLMYHLNIFLVVLFFASCSGSEPDVLPNPQFKNYSFDGPTIAPWQQVNDGVSWLYLGGLDNSVLARSSNRNSKLLMQGDFPKGHYLLEVSTLNTNPVEDNMQVNGLVTIAVIDSGGMYTKTFVVQQGLSTKYIDVELDENFSMIGFGVARIGPGSDLMMEVLSFKIISFNKN
jgi:hypothetical protein